LTVEIRPRPRINPLVAAPWFALAALLALWPRGRITGKAPPEASLSRSTVMSPAGYDAAEPGRGRLATAPNRIPARGWRDILWRTWKEANEDQLQIIAAGVTFYGLLAIFPALAAFVSLYGLFADVSTVQKQLQQIRAILPPGAVDLVGREMLRLATTHHASLSLAFALSLLLSLWSANAGMKALFTGLNIAYDEREKRGFFKLNLETLAFTVGWVAFLGAASAALVGVPMGLSKFGLQVIEMWWLALIWLGVVVMAVTAFALLYRFGPSREEPRWRWVTWGGVLAALAWMGGSLAFSTYVNTFAHYDKTYGSLGALVGFMVWLWFSILIVLLGAELNSEVEHQTAIDTTTGKPLPLGARGAVMADTVGLASTKPNIERVEKRKKSAWGSVRDRLRV
jgi:membrane protein